MANANGLAQISIVDICRLGGQLFRLLIFPSTSFNFQFSSMARGVGGLPNRGRLKWLQFTRARLAQDSHRTGRPVIKNFWYYLCKKKTNNETKSKPKNKNENESIKFALPWKHANKFGSTQSVGRQRLKFECNVSIRSSRYKCICICICCSKSHGCRASALSHLPWLPMAIGNFCKIRCWLLRNEKVLIWSLFLLRIWGGLSFGRGVGGRASEKYCKSWLKLYLSYIFLFSYIEVHFITFVSVSVWVLLCLCSMHDSKLMYLKFGISVFTRFYLILIPVSSVLFHLIYYY